MSKIKQFLPVLAIVAGTSVALAFHLPEKAQPLEYHYTLNSSNPDDFREIDNWQADPASPSCSIGDDLPCLVTYEGDFEAFLQSATLNDLIIMADETKSQ